MYLTEGPHGRYRVRVSHALMKEQCLSLGTIIYKRLKLLRRLNISFYTRCYANTSNVAIILRIVIIIAYYLRYVMNVYKKKTFNYRLNEPYRYFSN